MSEYRILYGDIHNHNAHGYGLGSIERSLDIARTHLDFFAFTGHSSWHDMPTMEGQRERHWIEGFKRLKETWPQVQQVIATAEQAYDMGAAAIGATIYFGSEEASRQIEEISAAFATATTASAAAAPSESAMIASSRAATSA